MAPAGAIVVPLDGTGEAERAAPLARFLADQLAMGGDEVTLLHVIGEHDEAGAREGAQRYLADVASTFAPPARTVVVAGTPAESIITELERSPRPLLCMSTHGRVGPGAALHGNIAERVLHRPSVPGVPVVLVGPASAPVTPGAGGPLVLCYDSSPEADAMAPDAIEWAQRLGAAVDVVMVLHRQGTFLGDHDATDPRRRATAFTAALNDAGVTARLELLDGLEPAHAIAAHCEAVAAPLAMAASHRRSSVTSAVLGQVYTRIAHQCPCPLLVVPPALTHSTKG